MAIGVVLIPLLAGILLLYCWASFRIPSHKQDWPRSRLLSFSLGIVLLIACLSPALFPHKHDLHTHMLQHLLLGMFAPLALVFAAPLSLLLRSLPQQSARGLLRLLRCKFLRVLSHPLSALLLNVGAMYLLYLTPLYAISLHNSLLNGFIHLHFLVAGCLFVWSIAGPDPGPHRPSPRFRLGVLFVAMASHALLGKLMYAYGWPRGSGATIAEIQAAAKLMYYGGDLAEMLLALALLMSWKFPGAVPHSGATKGAGTDQAIRVS